MKKVFSLVFAAVLALLLTACGGNIGDESIQVITTMSSTDGKLSDIISTDVLNPPKSNAKLLVTLQGENEATIVFTDDIIGKLAHEIIGDEEHFLNYISIFFQGREGRSGIDMTINYGSFNINEIPDYESYDDSAIYWGFSSNNIRSERSENSFSVTIKTLGISDCFRNCENYTIEFW